MSLLPSPLLQDGSLNWRLGFATVDVGELSIMDRFDWLCWIFFSQNNTHFQIILLVSIVSKLLMKVTSRV